MTDVQLTNMQQVYLVNVDGSKSQREVSSTLMNCFHEVMKEKVIQPGTSKVVSVYMKDC